MKYLPTIRGLFAALVYGLLTPVVVAAGLLEIVATKSIDGSFAIMRRLERDAW